MGRRPRRRAVDRGRRHHAAGAAHARATPRAASASTPGPRAASSPATRCSTAVRARPAGRTATSTRSSGRSGPAARRCPTTPSCTPVTATTRRSAPSGRNVPGGERRGCRSETGDACRACALRVAAPGDGDLPPPDARRLHLRRRRGGGPLPGRPGRQPPLPLPGAAGGPRLRSTGTTCWTTPRSTPELGGRAGLEALAATPRSTASGGRRRGPQPHGRSWPPRTPTPRSGTCSPRPRRRHAHWFDVDWEALDGRIGMPVLGDAARGGAGRGRPPRSGSRDGERVVRYHDHVFPVADGTRTATGRRRPACSPGSTTCSPGGGTRDECSTTAGSSTSTRSSRSGGAQPDVFDATHRLLVDLNRGGVVDGFRIDHPDGLADPEGYLERLRAASRPGTPVWVEKILEGDERLPGVGLRRAPPGTTPPRPITAALVDPARPALQTPGRHRRRPVAAARRRQRQAAVVDEAAGRRARRLSDGRREALPDADPDRLDDARRRAAGGLRGLPRLRRPGRPRRRRWPGSGSRRRLDGAAAARPDLGPSWSSSWTGHRAARAPPARTSRSGSSRPGGR